MGRAVLRIVIAVLGAGVFYTLWMVIGIPGARLGTSAAGISIFALAPVATSVGFAVGTLLGERATRVPGRGFLDAWISPLVACVIGAAAVYPFGPMLVVFGMFVLGTLAVVWREGRLRRSRATAG